MSKFKPGDRVKDLSGKKGIIKGQFTPNSVLVIFDNEPNLPFCYHETELELDKAGPKFKIGDRVEHNYTKHKGVILSLTPFRNFEVLYDDLQGITYINNEDELDLDSPVFNSTPEIQCPIVKPQVITTLKEARMQELQDQKRNLTGQAAAWQREGRCPDCGELGRFHISQAICSKHGSY
jgi:hypothetical protein